MMILLLRVIPFLLTLVQIGLLLLIAFFLFPYVALLNPALLNDPVYLTILKYGHNVFLPLDTAVNSVLPLAKQYNLHHLIKIILCIVLYLLIKSVKRRIYARINYMIKRYKIMRWRAKMKILPSNTLYHELEHKLEQIKGQSNEQEIEKLQREFEELKRKLETKARFLAFLSMDIVDSTGMKRAQDKPLIQLDFLRYKRLVESILKKHHSLQAAWTPDGVMICFDRVQDAIDAAQETLINLKTFNDTDKTIEQNFVLRCGVHAGSLFYDDKLPLAEVSDHVLDVTGHMQKFAAPGSLAISKEALDKAKSTSGFTNSGKIVDDYQLWQWTGNTDRNTIN